jgi:hypothetical protein
MARNPDDFWPNWRFNRRESRRRRRGGSRHMQGDINEKADCA